MSVASMVSPFTACAVAVFILYIAGVPSVMFIGIYTFPFFAYTVLPMEDMLDGSPFTKISFLSSALNMARSVAVKFLSDKGRSYISIRKQLPPACQHRMNDFPSDWASMSQ